MPTLEISRIAEQFGGQATPQLLSGGQGHSWRAATVNGAIFIKPSPIHDEARWIGEAFSRLAFAPECPSGKGLSGISWLRKGLECIESSVILSLAWSFRRCRPCGRRTTAASTIGTTFAIQAT